MHPIQQAILELVQDGEVFATSRIDDRCRVIFVAGKFATEEDRTFTEAWLENPHFGLAN